MGRPSAHSEGSLGFVCQKTPAVVPSRMVCNSPKPGRTEVSPATACSVMGGNEWTTVAARVAGGWSQQCPVPQGGYRRAQVWSSLCDSSLVETKQDAV